MNVFLEKCRLANVVDVPVLKHLFEGCFCVSHAEVNFFFEKKFTLDNCLVCEVDGKVASALHLMDAELLCGCHCEKVCYVYAASTFPRYRKRGFMSALINYSFEVARGRGKAFSVLKPETLGLYRFYEKLGYKSFFKESFFSFNTEELFSILREKYCFKGIGKAYFDENITTTVNKLSKKMCTELGGIFWNGSHINYALEYNELCGGKAFVLEKGFLVCCLKSENTLEVSEFFCLTEDTLFELLFKALCTFNGVKKYIFKVPVGCFKGIVEEKVQYCGMIRELKEGVSVLDYSNPYIGFTL